MNGQNRLALENVHLCAGCAKNDRETQLSGAQAAKTMRELKMKLCPRCRTIAKAFIAKRRMRAVAPAPPPGMKSGMQKVMVYSARLKEATTPLEIDDIVLDLASDPYSTRMLLETVGGLVKRKREELLAQKT